MKLRHTKMVPFLGHPTEISLLPDFFKNINNNVKDNNYIILPHYMHKYKNISITCHFNKYTTIVNLHRKTNTEN